MNMKRLFFAAALAALVFCSCDEEKQTFENFGKAEICYELTGFDGTGAPSADIFDLIDFTLSGTDFNNTQIEGKLTKENPVCKLTWDKAPTEDLSYTSVIFFKGEASTKVQTKETFDLDYQIAVSYKIYDKEGKVLTEGKPFKHSFQGTVGMNEIIRFMKEACFGNPMTFELCYVKNAVTDEWMYNFGVSYMK